jgi:hypothetical protein
MKKGLLLFAMMMFTGLLAIAAPTQIAAVQDGDTVDVTINWNPEVEYFEVELRGNFREGAWDSGDAMTQKEDGSWEITLTSTMGDSFEYKFFADDEWMDAEENYPAVVGNPYGGVNGFVMVDEALLAGEIKAAFSPSLAVQFNMPTRIVIQDNHGMDDTVTLTSVGWVKMSANILPDVHTFVQYNILGNSGDKSLQLWNETDGFRQEIAEDFLLESFGAFDTNVSVLTHYLLEYRTDYVNIAYLNHYQSLVGSNYGDNDGYIFNIFRVGNGGNAQPSGGGAWRLSKSGVDLGVGKLSYNLGWGAIKRNQWGVGGTNPSSAATVDWTTVFNFGYAGYMFTYFTSEAIDAMLYVGQVSDSNPENNKSYLNDLTHEIAFGLKGEAAIIDYALQIVTAFAPDSYYKNGEWKAGDYFNVGATAKTSLGDLGLKLGLLIGGDDYDQSRFFVYNDFGWDATSSSNVIISDGLQGEMNIDVDVSYDLGILEAKVKNDIRVQNPLSEIDSAAYTNDNYYGAQLWLAGAAAGLDYEVYGKTRFSLDDSVDNAFTFRSAGLSATYGLGMEALESITFNYGLGLQGGSSSATTDDGSVHSIWVEAGMFEDLNVGLGAVAQAGDLYSNISDTQASLGLAFGLSYDITILGRKGSQLYIQFQNNLGNTFSDPANGSNTNKGDVILDDFFLPSAGSSILSKSNQVVLGAYLDF